MRLKTSLKQPAPPDPTRYISRYLNEIIDYGGLPTTRAEAILDMQRMGMPQVGIDRWLQGQELMQRLRERRERLSVRLTLSPRKIVAESRQTPENTSVVQVVHPELSASAGGAILFVICILPANHLESIF